QADRVDADDSVIALHGHLKPRGVGGHRRSRLQHAAPAVKNLELLRERIRSRTCCKEKLRLRKIKGRTRQGGLSHRQAAERQPRSAVADEGGAGPLFQDQTGWPRKKKPTA